MNKHSVCFCLLLVIFITSCAINDKAEHILEKGFVQSIENSANSGFTPYSLIPVGIAGLSLGAYKLAKLARKSSSPIELSSDVEQQIKMQDGSRLI